MRRLCVSIVIAASALLAACDVFVPQCEVKTPLVVGDGWTLVPPAQDVLWPPPEGAPLCEEDALQTQPLGDDLAFEIDTRFGCGWATASQPIAHDVAAGSLVQVRVFYFSQNTFPAAEATVALALAGDIVMDERVAIPTSSGLLAPQVPVPRDLAAGELAHFHVGNHGDNSWNLVEVSSIGPGPCEEP